MKMKEIVTGFSLKEVFFMVGNTLCSNIGSLLSVAILAKMAVSMYSPITSALGVLNNVAVSLSFKEKQGKYTWIAVAIALVAVLI